MPDNNVTIRERHIQSRKMTVLGKTIRGVAHEVNNLIAIISANAEYLLGLINKNKFSLDEIDSLNAIQEYSTQAGKITQGLLDFSREDAEPQEVDINKEIETTLTFVGKQLEKQGIELIVNLAHSLPKIVGNHSQLRQVFLNLILNAKDAMLKGGSLTITTGIKRKKFIEMTFEDMGCGIPEDKMKRIFDLNFTTKEEGEGSGLGLAICYEIIKRHSGKITVKNRTGKGTTFLIVLPIK